MKKVFVFAAFALLFVGCNSTAKYKPMIEELATKWDSATSAVTGFAGQVQNAQSDMASMNNDLNVAPEVMEAWDDATKTQFSQIQSSVQTSMNNMSGVSTELDAFISSWQEKGKEVQALKDGLSAGKLEGDVQSKIADLTAAATDATAKLDGWKTKFTEIQAAAANAKQMLADFMQSNGLSG